MRRGSIVKRPSGMFAIRYRGPDGRRYYETVGPDEKLAEKALVARLREIDEGRWGVPSSRTLRAYAEKWLEQRDPARTKALRGRLSPTTHRGYRWALERHVYPRFGAKRIGELRAADVDDLVVELEAEGLAPGTVRNVLVPLRKLLGDAVRQGLITSNPAARCDLPPAQDFAGAELQEAHTAAIRAALLALASPDPFRPDDETARDLFWVAFFDVALGTGLRLGELRALAWRHVDRGRQLIRVERAWSLSELRRPKSDAGIRSVPLFPSVAIALDVLESRALEWGRHGPDQLIFQTAAGGPIQPANFNHRVWTPALQRAGLGEWVDAAGAKPGRVRCGSCGSVLAARAPCRACGSTGRVLEVWRNGYRFHDLRHTCVSRLVAAGADVKLVQAVAGHSNPLITLKRYSHLTDARVTEAARRFDPGTVRALALDDAGT
jgi:integrase